MTNWIQQCEFTYIIVTSGTKARSTLNTYLPKLTTSNTLMDLSFDTEHKSVPTWFVLRHWMFPRWQRKCFTNSIPSSCFFQNLTWPSTLPVTTKSVLHKILNDLQQYNIVSFNIPKIVLYLFLLLGHHNMGNDITVHITFFVILSIW